MDELQNLPIFAPYKPPIEIGHDMQLAAESLQHKATEDLITHDEKGISIHDRDGAFTKYLDLASKEYRQQKTSGEKIEAPAKSFCSLNLTYLPEYPNSLHQQFFLDATGAKKAHLFVPSDQWVWRSDVPVAVFKKFVEELGLDQVHLVRLIYLSPPAVGGIHIDTSPSSMQKYYNERQGVSLTFNIKSGDGRLFYRPGQDILQIDPALKAWHFDPSVPHAVGEVHQPRIQLRVFGALERKKYIERLDFKTK